MCWPIVFDIAWALVKLRTSFCDPCFAYSNGHVTKEPHQVGCGEEWGWRSVGLASLRFVVFSIHKKMDCSVGITHNNAQGLLQKLKGRCIGELGAEQWA